MDAQNAYLHHPRPGLHRGRHLDRRLLQPPPHPHQPRRQIPHRIRTTPSGPGNSRINKPSTTCAQPQAHCRRFLRGGAGGRRILVCVGDVFLCCGRGGAAAYGQVFLRRDRLGIVCPCARWDHRPHCRSGSPDAAFPQPPKVFTSAPYTSGGASWQPRSCVVVVS